MILVFVGAVALLAAGIGWLVWRFAAGPTAPQVSRTALALLGVSFLLGVAVIAVLPPWEGFDEIAHWSSIQQMADLHRAPVFGVDRLSADRLSYFGPEPRGVDARGRSYRSLRDQPPASVAGGPDHYRPDRPANWEAQHPPLFYALMAPVYRAAHGLGWVDHLLVLRLVSWLMGWTGLALGAAATQRALMRREVGELAGPWSGAIALLWPLVFAGFFADLARLGNDSLCLLLFGAVWLALLPLLGEDQPRGRDAWLRAAALAVLLGLGLWTKAFFGPISVSVAALLLARAVRARSGPYALQAALAVVPAWIVGALWYLAQWRLTGSLTGSQESILLAHAGGLLHGLRQHFHPSELVRGLLAMAATVGWVGTWSLTRLAEWAMAPSLLLLAGLTIGYGARLRGAPLVAWAPAAVILPVLAGLIYHVLQRLAIDGRGGGTPAWYLHLIAPPLGMMMALGWVRPRLFAGLAVLVMLYTAASWGAELSLFSGCTVPDAANHYDLAHRACTVDWTALSRLGHPGLALGMLVLAVTLAVYAAAVSRAAWMRLREPEKIVPLEAIG